MHYLFIQTAVQETERAVRDLGVNVQSYVCDITDRSAVQQTAAKVLRDFPAVDILINNAGILIGKDFLDLDETDIRRTFEINSVSHFWVSASCLLARFLLLLLLLLLLF